MILSTVHRVDAWDGVSRLFRQIALADAARARGLCPRFLVSSDATLPGRVLAGTDIAWERLDVAPGSRADALRTAAICAETDASICFVDASMPDSWYETALEETLPTAALVSFGSGARPAASDAHVDSSATTARPERSFSGSRWIPVRASLAERGRLQRVETGRPARVLVSFAGPGASDSAARVLDALAGAPVEILVHIAPPCRASTAFDDAIERCGPAIREVWFDTIDATAIARRVDLVATTDDATLWDFAWVGVPSVVFATGSDPCGPGIGFAEMGAAMLGGVLSHLDARSIRRTITSVLDDAPFRLAARGRLLRMLDGAGAGRILSAALEIADRKRQTMDIGDLCSRLSILHPEPAAPGIG